MWGEAEGFAPGPWRWICFFYLAKQTSAIFRTRQDARRYIVHPGCTIHHFKHMASSPANTAAYPQCRQFPAPGPRPLIHYMAVFLSRLLARTKPYTFVSFVMVCQVVTTMGRGISPAFIRGRSNLWLPQRRIWRHWAFPAPCWRDEVLELDKSFICLPFRRFNIKLSCCWGCLMWCLICCETFDKLDVKRVE